MHPTAAETYIHSIVPLPKSKEALDNICSCRKRQRSEVIMASTFKLVLVQKQEKKSKNVQKAVQRVKQRLNTSSDAEFFGKKE